MFGLDRVVIERDFALIWFVSVLSSFLQFSSCISLAVEPATVKHHEENFDVMIAK